jgi:glycosyltransferase involved in cell wall biosynthesis
VFALPSLSEGFALVVVDAMAAKVPIIISRLPVFTSELDGSQVVFFDPFCEKEFEKGISQLLEIESDLVEKAYKKYLEKYSLSALATSYLELYTNISKYSV